MKNLTLCAGFALATLLGSMAFAQISGGAQLGFRKYGAGIGSNLELGINGEYAPTDESSIRFGFNYGIPIKYAVEGNTIDNSTLESGPTVNGTMKINLVYASLDYKYYLAGGDSEDGGLYAFGGIGIQFFSFDSEKAEYEDYDRTKYTMTSSSSSSTTALGFLLRGGIGYEYNIGPLNIFGDLNVGVPANNANGVAIEVAVPASIGLNAGIKIPFG